MSVTAAPAEASTRRPGPEAEGASGGASKSGARPPRVGIVDAVRGLACVFMIGWHTADAWIADDVRLVAEGGPETRPFVWARILGGFAAPLFLWLAGLSAGLTTELRPSRASTGKALVRAGWIATVGYGLKLFAWTVDHGAILDAVNRGTLAIAVPSVAALVFATREPAWGGTRARSGAALLGAAGLLYAYSHLEGTTRASVVLARLDVLQGIGAALAAMALTLHALGARGIVGTRRAWLLGALGFGVALATPHWVGVDLDPLPHRLTDYLARLTADPAGSGARFPLFPWFGYALVGSAFGTLLREVPRDARLVTFGWPTARPALWLAGAVFVGALVYEGGVVAPAVLAHVEALRSFFRLAFYTCIALGSGAALSLVGPWIPRGIEALSTMGRSSLFVYGTHLEGAYGLVGSLIRRSVGWGAWSVGAAALLALMVVGAGALERWEQRAARRARASSSVPGASRQ